MVFQAKNNNEVVDASDIKSKQSIIYQCCDPTCSNPELIFTYGYDYMKTNIINGIDITSTINVRSHFKHKHANVKCNIELFLNRFSDHNTKEFYRKWTEPFIYNAIKNTFNSEYKMHVLHEDIMIMTSYKINKKNKIKEYENKIVNDEKMIWILNIDDNNRNTLDRNLIERKYHDNMNNITKKYYLVSNDNYYYDLESYDMNKSYVFLDFGLDKLIKLINFTFQGFEVEVVSIKKFLRSFNKIIKNNYVIPKYDKIKVIQYNIHEEIYNKLTNRKETMDKELQKFISDFEINHHNSKIINKQYIQLKSKYNIDYSECIQMQVYNNRLLYTYSYDCLSFIWDDNNDNFEEYYKSITCKQCVDNINIQDIFYNRNKCDRCKRLGNVENKRKYNMIIMNPNILISNILLYDFNMMKQIWEDNNDNFYIFVKNRIFKKPYYCDQCIENKYNDKKICNKCNNMDIYHMIKMNPNILNINKYDFDIMKQIWEYNNDNFNNIIKDLHKNDIFCNNCIKDFYNGMNICSDCQNKVYYLNIIKNKKMNNSKPFDIMCKIWQYNNDNFINFMKKQYDCYFNCNKCIELIYMNMYEKNQCNTCRDKILYEDIKKSSNINKFNNMYSFEYIKELWEKNDDNIYIFIKNKYNKITDCNKCIELFYNNNTYLSNSCDNCEITKIYESVKQYPYSLYEIKKSYEQLKNIWKCNNDSFLLFLNNNYSNTKNKCEQCIEKNYDSNLKNGNLYNYPISILCDLCIKK